MTPLALSQLNQMDQDSFTQALGEIFEHTPAIAHQTWSHRPFATVAALHQALVSTLQALPEAQQLTLIRAHPDLGTKAKMTDSSVQEQSSAGLDQLSPQEFATFAELNQAYRDKFQFPFIVAVKEHSKASILAEFRQRLSHDFDTERQTALTEIAKIAGYRLKALVEN